MKSGVEHKPNQCERILRHLQEHGSITQRQAIIEYGIGQPSARIWELRKQGHEIITTMTNGINRFDEPCKYAVYTLKEKEN